MGYFLFLMLTAFFAGRFSAPEKIKTETEKLTQTQIEELVEKHSNQQKTTLEIKYPDGKIIYRNKYIKINSDIKVSSKDTIAVTSEKKEITTRRGVIVSLLVGTPISLSPNLAYGVNVTKEVLGPINLGAWGLQSGTTLTAGVSVGLEF